MLSMQSLLNYEYGQTRYMKDFPLRLARDQPEIFNIPLAQVTRSLPLVIESMIPIDWMNGGWSI